MWNYRPTHTKPFAKSDQKHSKIAPKIIKNPLKIDPWRASGTPWRPYLSQEPFMYPLCTLSGSILDPKRDPKIDQKSIIFWPVFEWLFGTTFSCFWPPFALQKHLQFETQKGAKTRTRKSLILLLFTTLEPHWGVAKIIICCAFWDPF